jgi:excisionase family DNA binding protein
MEANMNKPIRSERIRSFPRAASESKCANQVETGLGKKTSVTLGLLTVAEAAKYLRVSKSFLDKSRVCGGGPDFIRLGKRKILYRTCDLDAWACSRRHRSTSEYTE